MMEQNFFSRNKSFLKAILIAFLVLMLTIPTLFIFGIISERQVRKSEVISEISKKWGQEQIVKGPILRIPFYENQIVEKEDINGKKYKQNSRILSFKYVCPENLKMNVELLPLMRRRGIFEVIVYDSKNKMEVSFKNLEKNFSEISKENILWDKSEIIIGISDLKGLTSNFQINNQNCLHLLKTERINNLFGDGIKYPIDLKLMTKSDTKFNFEFDLKGSQSYYLVPIAKENSLKMISSWKNPSFVGSFLPEKYTIVKNGFNAEWEVSHLNRNLPTDWQTENFPELKSSGFGVSLIIKNDHYQKSERALKYSILIISLTFLAFFFTEAILRQNIHPIQYILIGLALGIFYILLISISEITNFNIAYLISSTLTIGLIFLYLKSIFQTLKTAILLASILAVLYSFIYIILQLEDTALLIGSVGIFFILAITMYLSRKVNWYLTENDN